MESICDQNGILKQNFQSYMNSIVQYVLGPLIFSMGFEFTQVFRANKGYTFSSLVGTSTNFKAQTSKSITIFLLKTA